MMNIHYYHPFGSVIVIIIPSVDLYSLAIRDLKQTVHTTIWTESYRATTIAVVITTSVEYNGVRFSSDFGYISSSSSSWLRYCQVVIYRKLPPRVLLSSQHPELHLNNNHNEMLILVWNMHYVSSRHCHWRKVTNDDHGDDISVHKPSKVAIILATATTIITNNNWISYGWSTLYWSSLLYSFVSWFVPKHLQDFCIRPYTIIFPTRNTKDARIIYCMARITTLPYYLLQATTTTTIATWRLWMLHHGMYIHCFIAFREMMYRNVNSYKKNLSVCTTTMLQ